MGEMGLWCVLISVCFFVDVSNKEREIYVSADAIVPLYVGHGVFLGAVGVANLLGIKVPNVINQVIAIYLTLQGWTRFFTSTVWHLWTIAIGEFSSSMSMFL